MRTTLLCLLAIATACAPNADSQVLEFTEGADLGAKVTYDEWARLALVSFAKDLGPGQELFLSVRRGDLGSPDNAVMDCSSVAATAVEAVGAGTQIGSSSLEAHGTRAIYAVPLEDDSLLAPAYRDVDLPAGQSWAHGGLTPEKQALIDRGVDSFVDVCVTHEGTAVFRAQVDLFLALDLGKPNLVRDALASDAAGAPQGAENMEFNHDQARASSPQKYAEICVAALGEIPFFGNKREVGADPVTGRPLFAYDTFDCRDAVHIPMTVTTADASGVETVEAPQWDEQSEGSGACDRRQYIYPLCEQGPRVISARNAEGTHWVLLCRKGRGQTPKLVQQGTDEAGNPIFADTATRDELSTHYNDVAMLGHNPRTGRTCFFQNALYARTDGAHVPHPADAEKWETMWSGVHGGGSGINCNNCHDSDPFILSPWIAGARRGPDYRFADLDPSGSKPGTPVVPMMGVHPDLPMRDPTTPYTLVNYIAQGWKHEQQLVGEEVKGCNQCHRIGTGKTMRTWAERTVGEDGEYNLMITEAYRKSWRRSHFMPFDPNPNNPDPLPPEDQWAGSPFATAIEHIVSCQSASSACKTADIPRESAELGGGGECWSDIPDDCDY